MAYGVNVKKRDYSQEDLYRLRRKYPKGVPFTEATKESLRLFEHTPEKTHTKGKMVLYDDKLYLVHKVTPEGVYIQKISDSKEGGLETDVIEKPIFVKEKTYVAKVRPAILPHPAITSFLMTAFEKPYDDERS